MTALITPLKLPFRTNNDHGGGEFRPHFFYLYIMQCLTQLVGLDGCTTGNEPYKINQLGLSRVQLEELIDDSYASVDDWFIAMREFAAKRLAADVVKKVATSVHVETMIENGIAGRYSDRQTVTTASDHAGIFINLWNQSTFLKLNVTKISFYGNYSGDIDVKFIDVNTGKELDSKIITVFAGEVTDTPVNVEINSGMRDLDLAIVYDATGIESYKTTIYKSGCSDCGHTSSVSRYANFQGCNIASPFLNANRSARNDTAGLSIEWSWICDNESWVCTFATQLGLSMLYKTAYELLHYSLNSYSQLSDQQTINWEGNRDRMESFEFNYGLEMEKALAHARVPKNVCFSCDPKVGVRNKLAG